MARGLGFVQKQVLHVLQEHGGTWRSGCGWKWDTIGNTEKVLKSLVPHGLVTETGLSPDRYATFAITAAGCAKLKTAKTPL